MFYRSADWCAPCKSQLIELEDSRQELARRGLGIAAISYDSIGVQVICRPEAYYGFHCSRTKIRRSSAHSAFWTRKCRNRASSTGSHTRLRLL